MKAFVFLTVDDANTSRNAEPGCQRINALVVIADSTIREFRTGKDGAL